MAKIYTVWLCNTCDEVIEYGSKITKDWKRNHKCPCCKKGKMTKETIEI